MFEERPPGTSAHKRASPLLDTTEEASALYPPEVQPDVAILYIKIWRKGSFVGIERSVQEILRHSRITLLSGHVRETHQSLCVVWVHMQYSHELVRVQRSYRLEVHLGYFDVCPRVLECPYTLSVSRLEESHL